ELVAQARAPKAGVLRRVGRSGGRGRAPEASALRGVGRSGALRGGVLCRVGRGGVLRVGGRFGGRARAPKAGVFRRGGRSGAYGHEAIGVGFVRLNQSCNFIITRLDDTPDVGRQDAAGAQQQDAGLLPRLRRRLRVAHHRDQRAHVLGPKGEERGI